MQNFPHFFLLLVSALIVSLSWPRVSLQHNSVNPVWGLKSRLLWSLRMFHNYLSLFRIEKTCLALDRPRNWGRKSCMLYWFRPSTSHSYFLPIGDTYAEHVLDCHRSTLLNTPFCQQILLLPLNNIVWLMVLNKKLTAIR